jgi:hypothetical protein
LGRRIPAFPQLGVRGTLNKSGFVPAIGIADSTETFHSSTQVATQPEIISRELGIQSSSSESLAKWLPRQGVKSGRSWRGFEEKNRLPAINENFGIFMRFSTHVRQMK